MARLDIDDIRRGRRRDWEKLQDPEKHTQREQEEMEELRKKRESLLKRKARQRLEEHDREMQTWAKTKRELLIYAAIAGAVLLLYIGFKATTALVREARTANRFRVVNAQVESDERFFEPADAVGALGTWRNAWYRRNVRDLYIMSSPVRQMAVRGRRDQDRYVIDEQKRLDEGKLEHERSVAVKFNDPEIVRLPRSPGQDDLAVFRSQPLIRDSVFEGPAAWTVAFAWDSRQKQWQLVDVRKAEYWKDKWNDTGDIRAVVFRPAQRQSLLDP